MEALEGDGSGSSIQKDPKARCTDVGYLESWSGREKGTQAPGHPGQASGATLSSSWAGSWIQSPTWYCELRAGIQALLLVWDLSSFLLKLLGEIDVACAPNCNWSCFIGKSQLSQDKWSSLVGQGGEV